uniref:Uncharacterized protein n=1 Tax=Onchocerca volvulus TaxID=6282 RepID=A0A8R1TLC2_ONCVO
MEEMAKILELQQNNLTTTMTIINETTSPSKKMNITKFIKLVPSWMELIANLDNSEDLEMKIKNLEIPGMNASILTDVEEFNISAISESIHPSMNAVEVLESIHALMNESEIPENSTPSTSTFKTDAINDSQDVLEVDTEKFVTNSISRNTRPSMSASEASESEVPDNTHPLMNVSEVPKGTHPSMNEFEIPENTIPSISTFETEAIKYNQNVLEADTEGFSTNPVSGNNHPSKAYKNFIPSMDELEVKAFKSNQDILENEMEVDCTYPSMNAPEIPENSTPSTSTFMTNIIKDNQDGLEADTEGLSTNSVSRNTHPSEASENFIPSISTIDATAFKNNNTMEKITTMLSESTTLEQLESMLSSKLEKTESMSFSANNTNIQLSNDTRSEAISGAIYEKTDGIPTKCQSHADCYHLREPEAWCKLKSDEFWL